MASDTPSTPPSGQNKAQAEFDKYAKRRKAQAAPEAPGSGPAAAFPGENLTWAVPLGVGMAPAYPGGPAPGQAGPRPRAAGDLGDSLGDLASGIGATARLGVDLLNAVLFNGVKILGGFTGAYGHGHHDDCGCGCGCNAGYTCESCCEPSCCEPDCCGCECCHPSVGSCC